MSLYQQTKASNMAKGFLVGGLAGTVIALGQSMFQNQKTQPKLEPTPLHYHDAIDCFRLYEDLQHLHLPNHPEKGDQWKIYFGDSVRHVDCLIGLQKQLENNEIEPNIDHITLAIRYSRAASESLRKMEELFAHRPSWQEYVRQKNTGIIRHLGQRRLYIQDLVHRVL